MFDESILASILKSATVQSIPDANKVKTDKVALKF